MTDHKPAEAPQFIEPWADSVSEALLWAAATSKKILCCPPYERSLLFSRLRKVLGDMAPLSAGAGDET